MRDSDTLILENLYSILNERNNNLPFVSIDIQPFYAKFCKHIMPNFARFLNSHKGPIISFFNGSEVGIEDTPQDMSEFFYKAGVEEQVLDRIIYKEKGYAFFRNWMDQEMSRSDIIKAIRYMVLNHKRSSDDVSEEEWKTVYGDDWDRGISETVNGDIIYMPDINISELKKYNGCYLCGGGKDECLSEFRYLLEAFNIKYTLVKSLIY